MKELSADQWMEETAKSSSITVEELDRRVQLYSKKRREYEDAKAISSRLHGEQEELESKLIEALELAGKSKYVVEGHGTVYFSDKLTVKTPKTIADKKALFLHLRNQYGEMFYLDKISINHQTLQKLYNDAFKEHVEEKGNSDFHFPGLEAPTNVRTLNFRKEK